MGTHTVRFQLNASDIDRAIREVRQYQKELETKTGRLIQRLTSEGAEIAKTQIRQMDAAYTGELLQSVGGIFHPESRVGIIRAGAWYAAFVEFGTGVVGASAPHPNPEGWAYDKAGHGDAGWWYFNDKDQRWHWTSGMESRPFLFNTARELETRCFQLAREAFGV